MKWLAIGCVGILVGACGDARDVVARVPSPDGRVVAMLFESSGGATTSYLYEVELSSAGKPGILVSQLYSAARNDNAYGANLRWASDSDLRVEYLEAKREVVLLPSANIADRNVTVTLARGVSDPGAPAGGMAQASAESSKR